MKWTDIIGYTHARKAVLQNNLLPVPAKVTTFAETHLDRSADRLRHGIVPRSHKPPVFLQSFYPAQRSSTTAEETCCAFHQSTAIKEHPAVYREPQLLRCS